MIELILVGFGLFVIFKFIIDNIVTLMHKLIKRRLK